MSDPIKDLMKQANSIYTQNQEEFEVLVQCNTLFNYFLDALPLVFTTRDGHEVSSGEVPMPSEFDAAKNILLLLINEFHEIFYGLMIGSNNSAVRSSKILLDWIIRIICALTDLSIITGKKSDRLTPGCFFAFMEIYKNSVIRNNQTKFEIKSALKFINQLKTEGKIDEHEEITLKTEINFDVQNYINQFNSLIYENIELKKIETNETVTGKQALSYLHSILQDYPARVPQIIENRFLGRKVPHSNEEETQRAFSLIFCVLDVILTLIIILIDFDVYHGDDKWKMDWREKTQKMVEHKINTNLFSSVGSMFKSHTWNSDPPKDFVI